MEEIMKGLGWKPDIMDFRDHFYAPGIIRRILPAVTLPSSVNLSALCPPVYDQGELGSCTAQSVCALCDYLRTKSGWAWQHPSKLFLYFNTRIAEGTVSIDSGASLRNTIKTVADIGVCDEANWPYHIPYFAEPPSKEAYRDAELHQAIQYKRVSQNLTDLKAILAEGYPFVFGFSVYRKLYNLKPEKDYTLEFPDAGDELLGGHAVMAVGYDDTTETFLIRNSWGIKFGNQGYFKMPFKYLTSPMFSQDFWTIDLIEDGNEKLA